MEINIDDFLSHINYVPKFKGKDLMGVIIVSFKEKDGYSPSIEFGTKDYGKGQYLYFEIVNFNEYKEGEIIGLKDYKRRLYVYDGHLTVENENDIVNHINNALKNLYGN